MKVPPAAMKLLSRIRQAHLASEEHWANGSSGLPGRSTSFARLLCLEQMYYLRTYLLEINL
jgi:hypothetical protein